MTLTPLALPAPDQTEAWFRARVAEQLAQVNALADTLRAAAPGGLDTVKAYDDVLLGLNNIEALGSLFANTHPVEGVREAGEWAEIEADKLGTALRQDRAIYDALAAVDPSGFDALATRALEKALKDFRRSGVDADEETRAKLTEINERLTSLNLEFSKLTREDVRTIKVTPEQLDGLPEDFIESHPVGDDGMVTITTDYPDALPTRTYAKDQSVRAAMAKAFLNRGWPDAEPVLKEIFDLRHEYANLVGYPDWASFDADVKMIGTGDAIPEFIDRITAAAAEPMERDLAAIQARFELDYPGEKIGAVDSVYYDDLLKKEQYGVDSQLVRTYFNFEKVRAGLLEVTGRLFGLRYVDVPDAVAWDDDVAVYDVYPADGEELLGRIYLDLHPRDNKYKHAAQFTLVEGVEGKQLPEGVLVCNFSRNLMEHDHVTTLFHEFGHLMHHVLAGHGQWARFAGVATEWDFVEAPSQMLEEWAWDPKILASFATNAAGEPIPAELVEKMRAGDDFGKGIWCRTQMFYAAISYEFHTKRPADLTAAMLELQAKYAAYPYIPDTHFFAAFGHLGGYSSAYYTYMWSMVIAKDMFSAFDSDDMFDAEVAGRYRDFVLARGGEKDAADLVADFLGRPYSFDSYAAWLAK
ncbi:M3 family metallopeptidase [soil metagenome]